MTEAHPPIIAIIPARMASSRLPGKPLVRLLGRPLIEWVWRRVDGLGLFDDVIVATDSDEVLDVCGKIGANAERTDPGHPSGTDRVAEVARRRALTGSELLVNVQGDEPLIDPQAVGAVVELLRAGWPLATCASPLDGDEMARDPNVVKVVRAGDGRALYFSRAPVPWRRDDTKEARALERRVRLRHIGLYGYRADHLQRWVELAPSPLEELECLEQLRPLEAGFEMGVAVVDQSAPGVDTPEDVKHVERLLRSLQPEVAAEISGTT
jgi:3-deoxy-manno-octulosonate cytidylyltransferase (CMP-KDO synthetase)